MNNNTRWLLLAGITLIAVAGAWLLPPIPQNPAYHDFAAPLRIAGIPNFWNIVSNAPFAMVGVAGLLAVFKRMTVAGGRARSVDWMYAVFFVGVFFTAFGSSYYHWQPSNQSLVWDRLPMTLAFMSLFCMVVHHYESPRVAVILFAPLLAVGAGSVLYWAHSEAMGAGDLRPYALVQFLPILLLPLIIHGRNAADLPRRRLWTVLGWYAIAKLFEGLDGWIAAGLVAIGGHPFKHVFAALATWWIVMAYAGSMAGGIESEK
jgi:hypothetical protein